jgi:hypothetical protein
VVVDIAIFLNNISITADLVPGQLIELPKDYGNQGLNFFVINNIDQPRL